MSLLYEIKAQAAKASGDEKARIAAEDQISKIASGLNVVFEQYPDLKPAKMFCNCKKKSLTQKIS